jgi:hypothetical protein
VLQLITYLLAKSGENLPRLRPKLFAEASVLALAPLVTVEASLRVFPVILTLSTGMIPLHISFTSPLQQQQDLFAVHTSCPYFASLVTSI